MGLSGDMAEGDFVPIRESRGEGLAFPQRGNELAFELSTSRKHVQNQQPLGVVSVGQMRVPINCLSIGDRQSQWRDETMALVNAAFQKQRTGRLILPIGSGREPIRLPFWCDSASPQPCP